MTRTDVVVIGSGPNGMSAAVTLARAGLSVLVVEAEPTIGGGARTSDLGLADGVVHDLCSAVHPMAWASPFFEAFDLGARGVDLLTPEVSFAQPLAGGTAALAYFDLDRTVENLGVDGPAWRSLVGSLSLHPEQLMAVALGDKRSIPPGLVSGGLPTALRFGAAVLEQGTRGWNARFREEAAPALLTGVSAHAISPLPSLSAAGTALTLAALGHAGRGWPIPRGGSGAIIEALRVDLEAHGGRIETDRPVRRRADLPPARSYLFDTTPEAAADVLGVSGRRGRTLRRFRHGDGTAKVDFVLSGPVPWAAPDVDRAGTVHVGGNRANMAAAENAVAAGRHAERPLMLVSDPSVVDPGRVVGGMRPLWTYAHVPAGSDLDLTEAVTAHIELYAPGFRDVVVASRCVPADRMARHNVNYVGGDILGGSTQIWRMVARPSLAPDPYALGSDAAYLCSASTPPGPGVHGMGGWFAARRALAHVFGRKGPVDLAP